MSPILHSLCFFLPLQLSSFMDLIPTSSGARPPPPPNPPDPPSIEISNDPPDAPEIDLASAMQSLQFSTRRSHEDVVQTSFSLLVKAARSIPARLVPLQPSGRTWEKPGVKTILPSMRCAKIFSSPVLKAIAKCSTFLSASLGSLVGGIFSFLNGSTPPSHSPATLFNIFTPPSGFLVSLLTSRTFLSSILFFLRSLLLRTTTKLPVVLSIAIPFSSRLEQKLTSPKRPLIDSNLPPPLMLPSTFSSTMKRFQNLYLLLLASFTMSRAVLPENKNSFQPPRAIPAKLLSLSMVLGWHRYLKSLLIKSGSRFLPPLQSKPLCRLCFITSGSSLLFICLMTWLFRLLHVPLTPLLGRGIPHWCSCPRDGWEPLLFTSCPSFSHHCEQRCSYQCNGSSAEALV